MKVKHVLVRSMYAVMIAALSPYAIAQTALVSNGKSTFTIVIPAKAPTSVQDAAIEFQKDIHLATGVKLDLQKDTALLHE